MGMTLSIVMVRVEVPAPLREPGLKLTLMPEGWPVAVRLIEALKPGVASVERVDVLLPPACGTGTMIASGTADSAIDAGTAGTAGVYLHRSLRITSVPAES